MTRPTSAERFRELLQLALATQPALEGPHVVDDQALLAHWSADRLTDAERDALINHLGACAECREILQSLIENDLLDLPTGSINSAESFTTATSEAPSVSIAPAEIHPSSTSRRFARQGSLVAVAAIILVAGLLVFWKPTDQLSSQIARLEQDVSAASITPPQLDQAVKLLAQAARPNDQQRLRNVIEKAATTLAEQTLNAGDLVSTLELIELAESAQAGSGRLAHLKLQAEQGFSSGVLLAMNDRLDRDGGFTLRGRSVGKSLTPKSVEPDPSQQRWLEEFASSVRQFPEQWELRLGYARLLLKLKRWASAQEQLSAAVRLAPDNAVIHELLGVVAFERSQFDSAHDHFFEAMRLAPDNEAILVNLAITLERLDRHDEARTLWQNLRRTTTDQKLKDAIDQQIR